MPPELPDMKSMAEAYHQLPTVLCEEEMKLVETSKEAFDAEEIKINEKTENTMLRMVFF